MRIIQIAGVLLLALSTFACGGEEKDPKKDSEVECQGNVDCPDGDRCDLGTGKCVAVVISNNGTTNPNNGTTAPNNGTTNSNNGTTNSNNGTTTADLCGNDTIDGGETCDGDCPTQCDDMDTCTADTLSGSADACDAVCQNVAITSCVDGDGCCAPGCTAANDLDCDTCGNGVVDGAEACDKAIAAGMPGACPTGCNDNDACTGDVLVGNADQCSAMCSNTATTSCVTGDGCCPANCTTANDDDCQLNGTIFGSACSTDAECGVDNFCLTEADQGNPGGYCSNVCQANADCGNNAFCSGGICLPTCTTNAECRNGYSCSDFFGSGNTCVRDTNLSAPGAGCAADTECQGSVFDAVCFEEATNPNFAGGMCSLLCLGGDNDTCQDGANCTGVGLDANGNDQFVCTASCTINADCRAGYVCTDFDGNGNNECWPGATGNGLPGAACTGVQDCAGGADGLCANTPNFVDGYCTTDCTVLGCATGSNCTALSATANFCLDECTVNADCRTGYSCVDMDNNNTNECFPIASGSGGIGSTCSAVQDCAGGIDGFCIEDEDGFQGGYCSIDCTTNANACGADNCSANGANSLCLDNCTTNADCRAGYECGTFDGSTSCLPLP